MIREKFLTGQNMDEDAICARIDSCMVGGVLTPYSCQCWALLLDLFPKLDMVDGVAI